MTANDKSEKIKGKGFINRQNICVILSLICVIAIWYKPVLANEKSSNYRSIQRTHHVYFQWLLQDRHTLCGYQRMA